MYEKAYHEKIAKKEQDVSDKPKEAEANEMQVETSNKDVVVVSSDTDDDRGSAKVPGKHSLLFIRNNGFN